MFDSPEELGNCQHETAAAASGKAAAASAPSIDYDLEARRLFGVDLSLRREATVSDFMRHEKHVTVAERQRVETRLGQRGVLLGDLYKCAAYDAILQWRNGRRA